MKIINSMTDLFEAELDASQERNGWTDEQTSESRVAARMLADQVVNLAGFDAMDSDQAGVAMEDDVFAALAFAFLRIGLDDVMEAML